MKWYIHHLEIHKLWAEDHKASKSRSAAQTRTLQVAWFDLRSKRSR